LTSQEPLQTTNSGRGLFFNSLAEFAASEFRWFEKKLNIKEKDEEKDEVTEE
jgi:hypothetical protein